MSISKEGVLADLKTVINVVIKTSLIILLYIYHLWTIWTLIMSQAPTLP